MELSWNGIRGLDPARWSATVHRLAQLDGRYPAGLHTWISSANGRVDVQVRDGSRQLLVRRRDTSLDRALESAIAAVEAWLGEDSHVHPHAPLPERDRAVVGV